MSLAYQIGICGMVLIAIFCRTLAKRFPAPALQSTLEASITDRVLLKGFRRKTIAPSE